MASRSGIRDAAIFQCSGHLGPGSNRASGFFASARSMTPSTQAGRSGRIGAQRRMRRFRDLLHQARHRIGGERQLAGQQLKEANTQREQVRVTGHSSPLELFGRHERRGAQHDAGPGAAGAGEARDAEIRDLQHIGCRVVHEVRGLDVAMNHLLLVRESERIGGPAMSSSTLRGSKQVIGGRVVAQMAALQIFHRDVGKAAFFADIIDGHDVRVVEAARRFRLPEESRPRLGQFRLAELAGQRNGLDRDRAVDGGVAAEVDDRPSRRGRFRARADSGRGGCNSPLEAAPAHRRRRREAGGPGGRWRPSVAGRGAVRLGGFGADRRTRRGGGLSSGALGIHQALEAGARHRGRCCRSAPGDGRRRWPGPRVHAVRAGSRAYRGPEHRDARLAPLQFGETLFEVVQQPGRSRMPGAMGSWAPAPRRSRAARARRNMSALPPLKAAQPGSHSHEFKLVSDRSRRSDPRMPTPTIAVINPILRMQ